MPVIGDLPTVENIRTDIRKAVEKKTEADDSRTTTDRHTVTVTQTNGGGSATERDNMRGFDPACEDDMDDNGMSRYIKNNDDEGWD